MLVRIQAAWSSSGLRSRSAGDQLLVDDSSWPRPWRLVVAETAQHPNARRPVAIRQPFPTDLQRSAASLAAAGNRPHSVVCGLVSNPPSPAGTLPTLRLRPNRQRVRCLPRVRDQGVVSAVTKAISETNGHAGTVCLVRRGRPLLHRFRPVVCSFVFYR